MQQFTVPQFIDVEDKIIGPITIRQFVIMLVGSMFIAVYYKIFDFSLFIFSGLVTLAIFGIIAFAKINGRPFHYFILNFIQTMKRPGLRVWNNGLGKNILIIDEEIPVVVSSRVEEKRPFSSSSLSSLSLTVDTGGGYKEE